MIIFILNNRSVEVRRHIRSGTMEKWKLVLSELELLLKIEDQFEKIDMRPASSPVAMKKVEEECNGVEKGTETVLTLEE